MKITYYRTHYNGYDIFADFVDTDDVLHYVQHDDETVTISVAGTDMDGYEDSSERNAVGFYRRFEDEKRATLTRLEENVASLQKHIAELRSSTDAINEKTLPR